MAECWINTIYQDRGASIDAIVVKTIALFLFVLVISKMQQLMNTIATITINGIFMLDHENIFPFKYLSIIWI